jgi:signal transduction histidine kinase
VLTVTVRDEGRGFDPASIASGHGLELMRIWAELAGGTVTVDAVPGAGVVVTVRVPLA